MVFQSNFPALVHCHLVVSPVVSGRLTTIAMLASFNSCYFIPAYYVCD